MKKKIKDFVNRLFRKFGTRVVNKRWGPRGFMASFSQLKSEGYNPNVIYDVGASDGSWSLELKQLFSDSQYILFEPLPECADKLIEISENKPEFMYHPCALGSEAAELQLNQHAGQSSFLESKQWVGTKNCVAVKTIDGLVADGACPPPNLIKADVQGFELELLKGAEQSLKTCDFLFLELSWLQIYKGGPYAGEILGYLADRGFHVYDIATYAQRPLDGRLT